MGGDGIQLAASPLHYQLGSSSFLDVDIASIPTTTACAIDLQYVHAAQAVWSKEGGVISIDIHRHCSNLEDIQSIIKCDAHS